MTEQFEIELELEWVFYVAWISFEVTDFFEKCIWTVVINRLICFRCFERTYSFFFFFKNIQRTFVPRKKKFPRRE